MYEAKTSWNNNYIFILSSKHYFETQRGNILVKYDQIGFGAIKNKFSQVSQQILNTVPVLTAPPPPPPHLTSNSPKNFAVESWVESGKKLIIVQYTL